MLKILITGAGGLIGSHLRTFLEPSFIVNVIKSKYLYDSPENLALQMGDPDIIINLAGYPVAGRWNKRVKDLIYDSRITTTRNLVSAMGLLNKKPMKFINASAIGIYSDGYIRDEESEDFADNFLAKVVKDWEKEASGVSEYGIKLAIIRIGVVLARSGGAYPLLRRIFLSGIGGKIGRGTQGFSYILMNDLVRIFEFVIKSDLTGIINAVSPDPLDNETFSKQLAIALKRPSFMPVPGFMIRLILGEGSNTVLQGQKVIPGRMLEEGFSFVGNNLKSCLTILEK